MTTLEAGATAVLDAPQPEQPEQKGRRRGPMSPEEMTDVRRRDLQVDEAMVRRLIDEAKADFAVNMLDPLHAYMNPEAVIRHRRRFIKVMGAMAKLKSNGKSMVMVVLTTALVFGALYLNEEMGIGFDLFFALCFGSMIAVLAFIHSAFQEAFSMVFAVERRDFTDPGHATGVVRVYLPSLAFYDRPEVWRGNDGRNGIRNPKSFIVLSCGQDSVEWHTPPEKGTEEYQEWLQQDVWCDVTPGLAIRDIRTPLDYYDLLPDRYMCDGISMKHRRAWCRDLQRSGEAFAAWEKGPLSLMDGKWAWLYAGACLAATVFITVMALD